MCALCGVLAENHWSDATAAANLADSPQSHARRRASRVALVNPVLRYYGLSLADWGGHAFILSDKTGQARIVQSLPQIWSEAELLAGKRCDPLDPGLLETLRGSR